MEVLPFSIHCCGREDQFKHGFSLATGFIGKGKDCICSEHAKCSDHFLNLCIAKIISPCCCKKSSHGWTYAACVASITSCQSIWWFARCQGALDPAPQAISAALPDWLAFGSSWRMRKALAYRCLEHHVYPAQTSWFGRNPSSFPVWCNLTSWMHHLDSNQVHSEKPVQILDPAMSSMFLLAFGTSINAVGRIVLHCMAGAYLQKAGILHKADFPGGSP